MLVIVYRKMVADSKNVGPKELAQTFLNQVILPTFSIFFFFSPWKNYFFTFLLSFCFLSLPKFVDEFEGDVESLFIHVEPD